MKDIRIPCLPIVQAIGSLVGDEKLVNSVTSTDREESRDEGIGEKRVSSKALYTTH